MLCYRSPIRLKTPTRCDLYFGLGGHPGFRLPLEAGLAFSDYRLLFSSCCQPRRIGFTSNHFLDGTTSPFPLVDNVSLPLTHELFHHDAVVLENTARQVFLGSPKGTKGVTISFPSSLTLESGTCRIPKLPMFALSHGVLYLQPLEKHPY